MDLKNYDQEIERKYHPENFSKYPEEEYDWPTPIDGQDYEDNFKEDYV